MSTNTPLDIVAYYASLLIFQYLGKSKASGTIQAFASSAIIPQTTIQTISFSGIAVSGTFVLSYNGVNTATINWNDTAATIQSDLRAISGLSSITVAGSIASQLLTVNFTGVPPVASLLTVFSNNLQTSGSAAITLIITETDVTLPLAVQNAYNVTGSNIAQGVQLDVIAKYVGVQRTANINGLGTVTLDDTDFITLIQFGIIKNTGGSSLYTIATLLNQFFPMEIFPFDNKNMQMNYLVSTSIGSLTLLLVAIQENLIPKPMAVQLASIIYVNNINNLFGFRTYETAGYNVSPFNSYASYQMDWPWLSYKNAIFIA